jgi:hypothetical protein
LVIFVGDKELFALMREVTQDLNIKSTSGLIMPLDRTKNSNIFIQRGHCDYFQ